MHDIHVILFPYYTDYVFAEKKYPEICLGANMRELSL